MINDSGPLTPSLSPSDGERVAGRPGEGPRGALPGVVELIVRPTGLIDPRITVKPLRGQIDDLIEEIHVRKERDERVLVTTLTKRMAEELQKYLDRLSIPCRYIHSDVDTLERVEILRQLRLGDFDVLIGVNLLREGLDLPEVSLVAIIDADSWTALTDWYKEHPDVDQRPALVFPVMVIMADGSEVILENEEGETTFQEIHSTLKPRLN